MKPPEFISMMKTLQTIRLLALLSILIVSFTLDAGAFLDATDTRAAEQHDAPPQSTTSACGTTTPTPAGLSRETQSEMGGIGTSMPATTRWRSSTRRGWQAAPQTKPKWGI